MDDSFGSDYVHHEPTHHEQPEPAVCTPCKGLACWPVIIFVVFLIIVLLGILFSTSLNSNNRAWSFFVTLVWGIIWAAILWYFCQAGQHAIAWFILLIPIAIAVFWFLSVLLASATTDPNCVAAGNSPSGDKLY